MNSTDFGESIRHSGAYSSASEYYGPGSNATDEMDWRIVGGNSRLVNALAERVGLGFNRRTIETEAAAQFRARVRGSNRNPAIPTSKQSTLGFSTT